MNKGTASASLADQIIPPGVIWEWAGDTLPDPAVYGVWLWADGTAHPRAQYPRLFKHIGVLHGAGNGTTTFNVPNRKGRAGVGYDVADSDFNAVGKTGGSKTSTAPHTHTMNNHVHNMQGHVHNLGSHSHGMRNHYHGGGDHTHTVSSHGHQLENHSHGGGTGVHAHTCLNNIYRSGTPAHGHDGAGDQSSERPNVTTGFSSPGNPTNSVGVGNSGQGVLESPGTGGSTSGNTNWVAGWEFGDGNTGTNNNNTGGNSDNTGSNNDASGASSANATNGNLMPYIAMNYIVKA